MPLVESARLVRFLVVSGPPRAAPVDKATQGRAWKASMHRAIQPALIDAWQGVAARIAPADAPPESRAQQPAAPDHTECRTRHEPSAYLCATP